MARTPQRGRPQRGAASPFLRSAVALGGVAVHGLLCPVRIGSVAARMARRRWRDGAHPAGDPFLRRAVAHAGGAIDAILRRGRCAHAVIRNLRQRALAQGHDFLQRVLRLVPEFLRRLLRQRQPRQRQRAETPPPPPPQPPLKRCALLYAYDPRRRRPRAPSTSPPPPSPPPPPPPRREPFIVDGEEVPEGIVKQYANYCHLANTCPAKWTVCHFCIFEIQKSWRSTVLTSDMYVHCSQHHALGGTGVRCNETGCRVRVRAGRDQALHAHFCHRLIPGWWKKYL